MRDKVEARVRRVIHKGHHAIAFEIRSGINWKVLAEDYEEGPCTDLLTNRFMKGRYTMISCNNSEHEW